MKQGFYIGKVEDKNKVVELIEVDLSKPIEFEPPENWENRTFKIPKFTMTWTLDPNKGNWFQRLRTRFAIRKLQSLFGFKDDRCKR